MTLPKSPSGPLRLVLQHTAEDVFEPDAVTDVPLVRFVAFGHRHQIFGWVRLRADRLTDLLNAHPELHLADVQIEDFEGGIRRLAEETIVIHRRKLVAVYATGPRGDSARRQGTQTDAIAVQSGNYLIGGHLHSDPGVDPVGSLDGRPAMVPLTDAWIEYWSGGERRHRSTGTIIFNREEADWIRVATHE